MPTKVICCLCNRIAQGREVTLAAWEVRLLRSTRSQHDRLPFGLCSHCAALPENERRALIEVFIGELATGSLIAEGHAPDCARELVANHLRTRRSEG